MTKNFHKYEPAEERLNVLTHGLGLLLSIIGFVLLVIKGWGENHRIFISFLVFGSSMVILYAASTLYHSAKSEVLRNRLNIFDHAAIYVLIAGTYTPFALITLYGRTGWIIFASVWIMALAGIILKFFYTGKYEYLSTIMYVVMGWLMVVAIKPLIENFSTAGLWWLFLGGISYTIGALLFSLSRIKFNHAIFHIFVLLGTFCHFFAIYFYVI
ncbi:hemolysin D [Gramella sp. AN32]|nr:hemolysin D [Gramella sp. AN32]